MVSVHCFYIAVGTAFTRFPGVTFQAQRLDSDFFQFTASILHLKILSNILNVFSGKQ